ncbi:hypothetical protein NDR87_14310 [Nocardia sp. CDC159]|uniref:Uncharacterized protein n=1 Tax=Nocardia pulmonis TaxID=2951408 RepID=A0A9X2E9P1_9NOCA|nr:MULTISPECIES: hypothetical protein [Nocardia]MCM6774406.1 hypothetical protein [Nocardia pulmonis]MCM6787528.1 hypothetical protein [Nocardia sp. CDC159]
MFEVDQLVRIRPAGVSVFRVVAIEDDEHVLIEAVADIPGRYPFSLRVIDLIAADSAPL